MTEARKAVNSEKDWESCGHLPCLVPGSSCSNLVRVVETSHGSVQQHVVKTKPNPEPLTPTKPELTDTQLIECFLCPQKHLWDRGLLGNGQKGQKKEPWASSALPLNPSSPTAVPAMRSSFSGAEPSSVK